MALPPTSVRRGSVLVLALLAAMGCDEVPTEPAVALPVVLEAADNAASSQPGVPLARDIGVRVVDQKGRLVPGASVHWAVTGGGGSVTTPAGGTPVRSLSGPDGVARARWTLGPQAGPNTLDAWVPGQPPLKLVVQGVEGDLARILSVNGQPNDGRPLSAVDSVAVRVEVMNPVDQVRLSEFRLFLSADTTLGGWGARRLNLTSEAFDTLGLNVGFPDMPVLPGERDTVTLVTHLTPPGRFTVNVAALQATGIDEWQVVPTRPVVIASSSTDRTPPEVDIVIPATPIVTGDSILQVTVRARDRGMFEIGIVYDWATEFDGIWTFSRCSLVHVNTWDWPNRPVVETSFRFPLCRLRPNRPHPVIVQARDAAFNVAVDTFTFYYSPPGSAPSPAPPGAPAPSLAGDDGHDGGGRRPAAGCLVRPLTADEGGAAGGGTVTVCRGGR